MPQMMRNPALNEGASPVVGTHCDISSAMEAIYEAAESGEAGPSLMRKVTRLAKIIAGHFAAEGRFIDQVGCPDQRGRKATHNRLLDDFAAHAVTMDALGGRVTDEFVHFLRLTLSAHICPLGRSWDGGRVDHGRVAA